MKEQQRCEMLRTNKKIDLRICHGTKVVIGYSFESLTITSLFRNVIHYLMICYIAETAYCTGAYKIKN